MMEQPPQFEQPVATITPEQRALIAQAADIRRFRQAIKTGLMNLQEPSEESVQKRYEQQRQLIQKAVGSSYTPEISASAREETEHQIQTLTAAAAQAIECTPNAAALQYARAAELTEALGNDPIPFVKKIKAAIHKSNSIPKLTPSAFLPEALMAGILARSIAKQKQQMPTPEAVASVATDDTALLKDYALVLNEDDRGRFLQLFSSAEQKRLSAIMDRECSRVLRDPVASGNESDQREAVARRSRRELARIVRNPSEQESRGFVKLLSQTLRELGGEGHKKILEEIGSRGLKRAHAPSAQHLRNVSVARILTELSAMDRSSGEQLTLKFIAKKEIPPNCFDIAWRN